MIAVFGFVQEDQIRVFKRNDVYIYIHTHTHIYSLRHRKCGVRGYIHELFVSKPERASEGF